MNKEYKLVIKDEVNLSFQGLPIEIRKKINKTQKYKKHDAMYSVQVRYGGWDGTVSFFSMGGNSYVNLLPEILPILKKEGYVATEIEDNRLPWPDIEFDPITDSYIYDNCPNPVWPKNHPIEGEPIMLRDYQVEAINKFLENRCAVGEISTSAGKAQPLWSKVLTPSGYVKMGDIKVGDTVLTPSMEKTKVTGVFPQGEKTVYEITLAGSRRVYSCGEHLWKVKLIDVNGNEEIKVLSVDEILKISGTRVYVPVCKTQNNVDEDILLPVNRAMSFLLDKNVIIDGNRAPYRAIKSFFTKSMLSCFSSDTTGSTTLLTVSEYYVAIDIVEAGRSVGLNLGVEQTAYDNKTAYDIVKQDFVEYVPLRSIQEHSKEECQCIMVEDEEHLYVTDHYVVTHNTIMTSVLSHCAEKYGRTVVIVPNKDLVAQTYGDYANIGLDVGMYYGDKKDLGKTHTICTWQSLEAMRKNDGNNGKVTLEEFMDGVVALIVDEAHTISGDSLKELLCGPLANIPIRWGLTGTVPKGDIEKKQMEVSIGPKVHNLTAKELIDKGVLSSCFIDVLQLKEYMSFSQWPDEQKFIASDKNRITWLAEFAKTISQSGNTLILVNNLETGYMLESMIPDLDFIHGGVKSKDRKKKYDSVAEATNMIFAANYQVASTGINIPRIFNLIILDVGKSYTRVIQSIGRGIRKSKDKNHINVFDVSSLLKSSKKQWKKRKEFYGYVEYPYSETKVNYIAELDSNNFKTANDIYAKIILENEKRRNQSD